MPIILGQQRGKSAEMVVNEGVIDYSVPITYTVYDDLGTATEIDILRTNGLPIVNEPFTVPGIPFNLACKSKKCEQWEGNKRYWTVTCEIQSFEWQYWIPPTGGGGGGGGGGSGGSGGGENDSDDPESWDPKVSLGFESEDEVLLSDQNGMPIINTAKRRYASPLVRKRLIPVYRIIQYEGSDLDIYKLSDRHEVVNEKEYRDKPPNTWMCLVDSCEPVIKNGKKKHKITYCLKYRSRKYGSVFYQETDGTFTDISGRDTGWQPVLMQIDSHDINLNPLVDKKENNIDDFLNLAGLRLHDVNAARGNPIYLAHYIYPQSDFKFLRD